MDMRKMTQTMQGLSETTKTIDEETANFVQSYQ